MTKFGLAQSVPRVEDPRLLKGGGRYTDDIVLPGMLHGIVLRSPHASAKLGAIDTAAAAAVAGVKAIYTAADMKADGIGPMPCAAPVQNRDGSNMVDPPHFALADGMVRHVGDAVAFVVAETAKAARDAAELVVVDYSPEPAVTDVAAATSQAAPLVWPDAKYNVAFDWGIGDKAATDALFAQAAHVTRLTVVNNRVVVASMEGRAAIADYDTATNRWTLYANTQGGWLIKNLIATSFGTEPASFRVITPDVGGGFGMKAFLYGEHVLACYAARKLGRPVKWTSDRAEAFLADTQGRDNVTLGELAIDKDGRFLALRTRNLANMGAYLVHVRAVHPDAGRRCGAVRRLRPEADLRARARRVHPYGAGGRVSRRRSAREQLSAGTAGRCRCTGTQHRSRRAAPAQHGTGLGDAAHDAGGQDVRHRRLPDGAGRGAAADGLRGLRCQACRGGAARQASRHRPVVLP